MSTESHNLLEQALALSESDRAAIAASLIHSLDAGFDDDAKHLWDAEINKAANRGNR